MGYILMGYNWDFFADGFLWWVYPIYLSLPVTPVKEFPLLVLLADMRLVLLAPRSYSILDFLPGVILGRSCIFGYSSFYLNDFLRVCYEFKYAYIK